MEHDNSNVMVLGAVWCPKEKRHEINGRIKEIKARNGIQPNAELKWTKVSPVKKQVYEDLINYFFDEKDLHFRVLLIPHKDELKHLEFNQTHDEWYNYTSDV